MFFKVETYKNGSAINQNYEHRRRRCFQMVMGKMGNGKMISSLDVSIGHVQYLSKIFCSYVYRAL